MDNCFVGLPKDARGRRIKTYLYKEDRKKKVREVLWGDWLSVDGEEPDGWLRIVWGKSGENPQKLYIPAAHTAETRPLEIVFLDVGQGDGAVLITPERDGDERIIVIDAGAGDEMHSFLSRRFRYKGDSVRFHAAVITHPDSDHYAGFETILGTPFYRFDVIYHSGLMERPVDGTFEKLGGLARDPATGREYLRDLLDDRASVERVFGAPADLGDFLYPRVIRNALENPNRPRFAMLSTATAVQEDGRAWMPEFAPSSPRSYEIEVLGPVPEPAADGTPRLRRFDSYGETKNGHSVILRLRYAGFTVLFGGDLNDKAEKFLLTQYGGKDRFPAAGTAAYSDMVTKAAGWFRSDVMKVCHHGSEKVTDAFLETVWPAAFVISSGDAEGHVHPRPDLLGRLGKLGRGASPVLLSTELQRSTRDKGDAKLAARLMARLNALTGKPNARTLKTLSDGIEALSGSTVMVDGTIYLKTDGDDLVTAFRIETASEVKKWFVYQYGITHRQTATGTEAELTLVR